MDVTDFDDRNHLPDATEVVSTGPDGRQFRGGLVIVRRVTPEMLGLPPWERPWYVVASPSCAAELVQEQDFDVLRAFLVKADHLFPGSCSFLEVEALAQRRDEVDLKSDPAT